MTRSYETEHAAWVLWRYHNRPAEELYDMEVDPNETRNLAGNLYYGKLLKSFREQMTRWRTRQGDFESGPYEQPERRPGKPVAPYIFK